MSTIEIIQSKIYLIRGHKVMLDRDIALLYGVKPIALRQQVKRNIDRFPDDFMIQLTVQEVDFLLSQNVIPSKQSLGGALPYAFTEQGVAMLSSVLTSKRAVHANIQIMRTFAKLREIMSTHKDLRLKIEELEKKYDHQFKSVFDAIRRMMITTSTSKDSLPNPYKRTKVGFIVDKESASKGRTHAH
jgi:hypothetical protein